MILNGYGARIANGGYDSVISGVNGGAEGELVVFVLGYEKKWFEVVELKKVI